MNCIDLNKRWNDGDEQIDLPYDRLTRQKRNYNLDFGAENSFYSPVYFALTRSVHIARAHKNILEIDGVCGTADVFDDDVLKTVVTDKTKHFLDLGGGARNARIQLGFSASNEGKYTGAGIAHGIKLFTAENPVYIPPYGLSAVTVEIAEKAFVQADVTVTNDASVAQKLTVEVVVLNARGKRVGKRQKKVKLSAGATRTVSVPVRVSRFYEWSLDDPYLYTCRASVSDAKVLDTAETTFGIRTLSFDGKSFRLNGKAIKLRGGTVFADNGLLGAASFVTAERRKFDALKQAGYNAVRVTQPSEAVLDALDRAGLLAVVDLLEVWRQPKHPLDRHRYFDKDACVSVETQVRAMKSRACVAAYSLGSDLPESYGRGDGLQAADKLIAAVKAVDPDRPVLCELGELIPTAAEVAAAGGKATDEHARLSYGREKDLFRKLTADFADKFDLVGYNNLSHRYPVDKLVANRAILGTGSSPKRAFEACEDGDKNGTVGELSACAVDHLGAPKVVKEGDLLPQRSTDHGEFDIAGYRKPLSFYREIAFGVRPRSYITVTPEDEKRETGEWQPMQGDNLWNWPRHVGKPVIVEVYTSGEVVALYLDGKLIGRKLAGKVNKQIATFRTNYYPGKLEAVSFHRGREHSRCTLETVSSPKQIKLSAADKYARLDGDGLCYVDITVCDASGRPVPFAQREITLQVSGEGELFAVGNGDPHCVTPAKSETVPVHEGRAVAVVRGVEEGKIVVKATSDGLLSGRLTIKVR